jgi:hypothetical protein
MHKLSSNDQLMKNVVSQLEPSPRKINEQSPESKGPLEWKEDSQENDIQLEDISRFIEMRKDLLDNNFSFKLTNSVEQTKFQNKTTPNVFEQVLGNTLLKTQPQSLKETFLQSKDYQLSMTTPAESAQ